MSDFEAYKQQLEQIDVAIGNSNSEEEIESLISLKNDIEQLLSLTEGDDSNPNNLDDEYASFVSEIAKEGAFGTAQTTPKRNEANVAELKKLEGTRCRAPHRHTWGETVLHNAMICSIIPRPVDSTDARKVKVMFLNPTHREMLPCPYFLKTDCKFTEDACNFSHGEIVPFAELEEYSEPDFESVGIGTKVLAKSDDDLWYRATVKRVFTERCLVKFDTFGRDKEMEFCDVFPLGKDAEETEEEDGMNEEDVINYSLTVTPALEALGGWEKHTKGIGSKLMEKMGYITGSGLGKKSDGRLEPVSAVILPPGKSLDHCMYLREKSGGDKDLFSVEKKLKRRQKRIEARNRKVYERERKKPDVFEFLNSSLTKGEKASEMSENQKHREEVKAESSRGLNVAKMKIDEEIRSIKRELFKITESLERNQIGSKVHTSLKMKQRDLTNRIEVLKGQERNIIAEKGLREDKKKMTVF